MQRKLIATFILFSLTGQAVFSESTCSVIGIHEPNSNIYDGPTWCEHVHLSDLDIRGPLIIDDSKIDTQVIVSGPIKSSDTSMQSIQIKNNLSKNKITLVNGTKVFGNIEFKGVKGVVYIDQKSKIIGRIINGEERDLK